MQASNYTQSLQNQGLKTPSQLNNLYEINPMGGGRIVRDKLWFYTSYRQISTNNTVPGMWFTKTADTPTPWTVNFAKSQKPFTDPLVRTLTGKSRGRRHRATRST